LDADTGTELWTFATGAPVDTSPAVVDGTVYVGSDDTNVYALAEESTPTPTPTATPSPTPTSSPTATPVESTRAAGPGFGGGAAVVGLLLAVALGRRRR
jgi:PGF-CTERM protein